jgi:hypothetical protein
MKIQSCHKLGLGKLTVLYAIGLCVQGRNVRGRNVERRLDKVPITRVYKLLYAVLTVTFFSSLFSRFMSRAMRSYIWRRDCIY